MSLADLPSLPPECLSDLVLDRYRLGELERSEAKQVLAHLGGCHRCQRRSRELEEAAALFLAAHPELPRPRNARPPMDKAGSAKRGQPEWARFAPLATGIALAASVLFLLGRAEWGSEEWTRTEEPSERSKGGARLAYSVKRGDVVFEGGSEQTLRPGDRVRFVLSLPAPRYVAVLSRDGAGVVSSYFPPGSKGRRLQAGRDVPLPGSIELDDVLGREEIWGVFCEGPFELEPHLAKLRAGRKLSAPRGCSLLTLHWQKESGP